MVTLYLLKYTSYLSNIRHRIHKYGFILVSLIPVCLQAQPGPDAGWWITEPVRLVQTNLREWDDTLNAGRLIGQVKALGANTLLFSMVGLGIRRALLET